MTIEELSGKFTDASEFFAESVQKYLSKCDCDEDTKAALDEIAHQAFDALVQSQDALIEYLESK